MKPINLFHNRLFQVAVDKKLWLRVLGQVDSHNIWFVRVGDYTRPKVPRLLIAGGFHGEEKAGPLAILDWLETFDPNIYQNVNLAFLPLVNPSGYADGHRYNYRKQRSNCGFCHPESGDQPSEEGVILLKNLQLLRLVSRDGFHSIHEDVTSRKFYLYSFERSSEPTTFTYSMRDKLAEFFETCVNDEYITTDASGGKGVLVKDGIVYKLCDGSCEDWLFHEGTMRTIVTETPGTSQLAKRIRANRMLIDEFIRLSVELYRR